MAAEVRVPLEAKTERPGVEFMIPTGAQRASKPYHLGLEPGEAPACVGLLANGFPEGDIFLGRLADALRASWPQTEFKLAIKAKTDQLNMGIQEPLLTEMVNTCDAVIIAWGHCGSCTLGVTRDGISFAERGIPSVTLICDIFWDYSEWLGKAMGLTGLPRIQIPFPIAGTSSDNQISWANRIAPDVIAKLETH
jgi:hypothetical protein